MSITVVGAGFAGLATCWHLLEAGHQVVLMDQAGIGSGASGVSPGLLHPYIGKHAKPTPDSIAGFEASKKLLDIAGSPYTTGVMRNGRLLPEGLTVDTKTYLHNLWEVCAAKGATFIQKRYTQSEGTTILCTGHEAPGTHPLKGQILELAWPKGLPRPEHSIIAKKYLVMKKNSCLVGATYEHDFTSKEPDVEVAKKLILPGIIEIYPELANAEVLSCHAGIRATVPGRFPPLIKQLDDKTWVYAGLGSKGLLYHALFAQRITI